MIRAVSVLLVVSCLALPAAAQTPALVDAAIASVEARGQLDQRWAFTRTVSTPEASFAAAYDPSLPPEEAWSLVSPASADQLTDDMKRMFEGFADEEEPDRAVVIGDSAEDEGAFYAMLGEDVRLVRETAEEAVFSFRPQPGSGLGGRRGEGAVPESVSRHLMGELMVEVGEPVVSSFRIFAERSFKPSPVARLDALDIVMELGETEPGGPIAVVTTRTSIAGSALFNAFEQTITVENSGFVRR